MTDLLKKDEKFCFDVREKEAFMLLKAALSSDSVLKLYNPNAETELYTDASRWGYGMILLQRGGDNRNFHPVYFASDFGDNQRA